MQESFPQKLPNIRTVLIRLCRSCVVKKTNYLITISNWGAATGKISQTPAGVGHV